MKKYCYFVGLLVIHPLISASYSSLTLIAKDHSPPLEQAKHTQAVIPAVQTAHDKKYKRNITALLGLLWLWTLARFYSTERRRRIPEWQMEDLALIKNHQNQRPPALEYPPPGQKNHTAGCGGVKKPLAI